MNRLLQDLAYALRQLRKNPGFTAVAVLTLGLGIGANTAIFSMVDWLVLRPLPIKNPKEMSFLVFSGNAGNFEDQFSYPEFTEIRKQTTNVFAGMVPFIFGGLEGSQSSPNGLTVDGVTKSVQTVYVGGDFFSLLGITPYLGRFILPAEGTAPGADPVVVLSYNYWQSRFGNDPSIVPPPHWLPHPSFFSTGGYSRRWHQVALQVEAPL